MPDLLASLQGVLGDRYQLEGELGHGGMATVYRAIDRKLDRAVAIKVLSPDLALILGSDRFRREIAIATQLTHPNIVPLLDSGGAAELLYYVMPLINGETLRDQLLRETQLPLEEALRIARAVADALGYAHTRGIVHRDIKPENILLSAGQVYVADFGIARAITLAGDDRLTSSGMVPGTPPYMSPEQADGKVTVDGRSDLYALGCVLYEMLAGQPPFTGPTAQSVLAQHLSAPVPSLRIQRRTIPPAVEAVIMKLLSKVPADRFATASRMVVALDGADQVLPVAPPGIGHLVLATGAIAIVAALLVGLAWWRWWPAAPGAGALARYAVLPLDSSSARTAPGLETLLHDALLRWAGLSVLDPRLVRDGTRRYAGRELDAGAVARALRVARVVRGALVSVGDTLTLQATLYDSAGTVLSQRSAQLPRHGDFTAAVNDLADGLVIGGLAGESARDVAGTHSLGALMDVLAGRRAAQSWNLAAADSAFGSAAATDEQYAPAFFWLAQVRFWRGQPVATWQSPAVRAASNHGLGAREAVLNAALLALAGGDRTRACEIWRGLAHRDHADFAAWFSLAQCLVADSVVLPDARSPTRWRFRSSYQEALQAYETAFQLRPELCRALSDRAYASVRDQFFTRRNTIRWGRAAAPDTMSFAAYPSWDRRADTLVFRPRPHAELLTNPAMAEGALEAVNRERQRFERVALAWVASMPENADALVALAVALDLSSSPAALDTLRHALRVARTPQDSTRIAGLEVWISVRQALPGDSSSLKRAVSLAGVVLARAPSGSEAMLLSSLAALTGQAGRAAVLARDPSVLEEHRSERGIVDVAYPLLVFAALGGPDDSLRLYGSRLEGRLDRLQPDAASGPRGEWLVRAATMLFPDSLAGFVALPRDADPLLLAQEALRHGNSARARGMLASLDSARGRQGLRPGDLTFDEVYAESQLRNLLEGPEKGGAWLDSALSAVATAEPGDLADPAIAGSLARSIALRAELADRSHDPATAARWARALGILWVDADDYFQPLVRRMRRLAA